MLLVQHINVLCVNFRSAGARQCVSEQRKKKKPGRRGIVFCLDLKNATESLPRTVFGSEFQTQWEDAAPIARNRQRRWWIKESRISEQVMFKIETYIETETNRLGVRSTS